MNLKLKVAPLGGKFSFLQGGLGSVSLPKGGGVN